MALIVEDGTGLTNSECYCDVAFADLYHSNRGNTLWATLSTNEKEQAIRRSADFMIEFYRSAWQGVRVLTTQAMDWPRNNVVIDQITTVASNIVPLEVKQANAALSFTAAQGELLPDQSQGVLRKKVDVIEIEYDINSSQTPRYKAIDALLAPYLLGISATSANIKMVRI